MQKGLKMKKGLKTPTIDISETKGKILVACLQPKSWTELKKITGISDPTLAVHLKALHGMRLLRKKRDGMYQINNRRDGIAAVQGIIRKHLHALHYWFIVFHSIEN